MATYVNDLRLKEIATGDESGTWGTSTNTNLELIAEAFSYGTEAITTNADTHTTTIADGSTDPGRSIYLKYTGTLDSACTITIGPNTVSKLWFIENATSGSQNIIISQGSGANITIPAGDTKVVYSDGAGSGAAFFDAFASLNVVDLKVQDDLTVTDDLIVNGDIDLEGSIDVNGTANLDVVDIDGALTQDGGAVFNEASADVDFRVESDGNANMLFVDGGTNRVGIGLNSPQAGIDIDSSAKGIFTGGNVYTYPVGNAYIKVQGITGEHNWIGIAGVYGATSGSANLMLQANLNNTSQQAGNYIGSEAQSATTADITFGKLVGGSSVGANATKTEFMRIDSSGNVGIGLTPLYSGNGTARPSLEIGGSTEGNLAFNGSGTDGLIVTNSKNIGGVFKAAHTGLASAYGQTSGEHIWYTAASVSAGSNQTFTERMRIDSSGNVGIGVSAASYSKLDVSGLVKINSSRDTYVDASEDSGANAKIFVSAAGVGDFSQEAGHLVMQARTHTSVYRDIIFAGGINNASELMRITGEGNVGIGGSPSYRLDVETSAFDAAYIATSINSVGGGVVLILNRSAADGDMMRFQQGGTTEGTIVVNGSTVSYNGFSGNHESSGINSSTPIGTVVSTIDELDVYSETQTDKGKDEPNPKAGQTRADHAKIKISDTEGDTRVYGILNSFNADGKAIVTSVGIGSIKVTGACNGGDLLESNGDGTAKVQSDDIVRSKTIGKVTIGNSDTGVKLVSCVLYCG